MTFFQVGFLKNHLTLSTKIFQDKNSNILPTESPQKNKTVNCDTQQAARTVHYAIYDIIGIVFVLIT